MSAADELRAQTRAALTTAGISQASAARTLGLSEKHMSQMLTGRATLTLTHAEQIVALCGAQLVIAIHLNTPKGSSEQSSGTHPGRDRAPDGRGCAGRTAG